MELCEFCGSILEENGRCPWDDCPHNAIIDVMAEAEGTDQQQRNGNDKETEG